MHEKFLTGFKHWTVQKLGWHNTQAVPDPKLSMRDSTEHSVSLKPLIGQSQ